MSNQKKIIGIIVVLLVLTCGIYFGGVGFFSSHFLPRSYINDLNFSFQSEENIQTKIAENVEDYSLTVNELGGQQEVISGKDIELAYVKNDAVHELLKDQNPWRWILSAAKPKKYTITTATTYNKKKLKKLVNGLDCLKNMTEPSDARVDLKNGSYYIVPEVEGNKLEAKTVYRHAKKCVESGSALLDLVDEKCYVKPAVYRDDKKLIEEAKTLNQYTKVTILYDFGDREEVVDGDMIRSWLTKNEKGTYELNEAAMADYVYQLAYKYDTFGGTREFTTATGKKITLKGGDYGYVIKQDATVQELKTAIENGQSGTREPVYLYKGVCRNTNDIGDTYVEINLEAQAMYFYKDGKLLVNTPVVTGNPNRGNATPTGVYALDNKKSPAVLKGEDYESNVTYWMPFNHNVGIHDCGTWRTEFGGNIYLTNGSHGCINTPFEAAETIYKNIEIGMPIIVY